MVRVSACFGVPEVLQASFGGEPRPPVVQPNLISHSPHSFPTPGQKVNFLLGVSSDQF